MIFYISFQGKWMIFILNLENQVQERSGPQPGDSNGTDIPVNEDFFIELLQAMNLIYWNKERV